MGDLGEQLGRSAAPQHAVAMRHLPSAHLEHVSAGAADGVQRARLAGFNNQLPAGRNRKFAELIIRLAELLLLPRSLQEECRTNTSTDIQQETATSGSKNTPQMHRPAPHRGHTTVHLACTI